MLQFLLKNFHRTSNVKIILVKLNFSNRDFLEISLNFNIYLELDWP